MMYCSYYQAHVTRDRAWNFVALLRSYEHIAFDRTFDKEQSIFEFFVPSAQEDHFVAIMHLLEKKGLVGNITKLPNRLEIENHPS